MLKAALLALACLIAACSDPVPLTAGVELAASHSEVVGSDVQLLGIRELIQPYDYVDDHPDGPDVQVWDETVTPV